MNENVAIIAGSSGTVGNALAREISSRHDWKVYGLSRRDPQHKLEGVDYFQMDLNDSEECVKKLSKLNDITHAFYCGRATHEEQVIEGANENLILLDNFINAIELASVNLKHVHLVQGGKFYGVHLGPFPTPAKEEDFRAPIQNFNYDQQDYLSRRSIDKEWSWTASRPNTLLHFSPHIARNIVSTIGAYAAICREVGAALDFPGHPGAYTSVTQMTTIELLSRGIVWMSTEPLCKDQAFNIINTDVFRWNHLWPKIAQAFKMDAGTERPLRLENIMSGRNEVWKYLCEKYKLKKSNLNDLANWQFADATFERHWDEIFSHNKSKRFGFQDWDESELRFLKILKKYQDSKIIPF